MVLTNVIQSLSQTGIPRRRIQEFEAHNLYDLLKYEQKGEKLLQLESEKRWGRHKLRTKLRVPVKG